MSPSDLRQEIGIEWDSIQLALDELNALRDDVRGREPTVRELAAAGLFMANLYNGVENILKRIARFQQVEIRSGAEWHIELVKSFCEPPRGGLPILLPQSLASRLAPYRRFRHVVHHGYGFQLRWTDMLPGIQDAPHMIEAFRKSVNTYLDTLKQSPGPE
jgi:hypothetical protein